MSTRWLLLRSLASLVVITTATVSGAQTTGTLVGVVTDAQSGGPLAGALVVATSPHLQGQQTVLTDQRGAFRITLLPPGDYRLAASLDGYVEAERLDIELRLDQTLRANLVLVPDAVRLEEQVVKTGQQRPVIDVGSAESGAIVTREFLDSVPFQGRGFQVAAFVAPTARGDGFGIAFAGSTAAENGYLLDGMNVADPVNGLLGQELRRNFLQEMEVKSGNFMPEYGFSTGGIINVVTRSGSNELHGSLFASFAPGRLSPDPKAVGRDAEALSLQASSKDGSSGDVGVEVGGPILKDRLWFYFGFSPGWTRTSYRRMVTAISEDPANPGHTLRDAGGFAVGVPQPEATRSLTASSTQYQLTGKLTLLLDENNTLSVSFTSTPTSTTDVWTANASPSASLGSWSSASSEAVARYTSKLMQKRLNIELLGGWHRQAWHDRPQALDGVDQRNTPNVYWSWNEPLGTFQAVPAACQVTATGYDPCPVSGYGTGGWGAFGAETDDRFTAKGALTWSTSLLGPHQLKAGAELNQTRSRTSSEYSGGQWIYAMAGRSPNPAYRSATGFPDAASNPFVSAATYLPGLGYGPAAGIWYLTEQFGNANAERTTLDAVPRWETDTAATTNGFYLQDSWSPLDGLTINAGLRWEVQSLGVNGQPVAIEINDNVAPRVQAIYDWTRQGRSKLSASWGRFYEAIPLDIANRAFQLQRYSDSVRAFCYDPRADPTHAGLASGPGSCAIRPGFYDTGGYTDPAIAATYSAGGSWSGGSSPGSVTPIDPHLKGQYVDMVALAAEYELLTDLSIGVEYQGRRLGRVIESIWNNPEVGFLIGNPATGAPWTCGPDGLVCDPSVATGAVDPMTGRSYTTAWPKPERRYDGLTLSARKSFSNRWQLQASYTFSSLRGNYAGLATPEGGQQLNPNTSGYYNAPQNIENRSGPLPGDSRHQLKAFGSYTFELTSRLSATAGGALRVLSGTPVNYKGADQDGNRGEIFLLPRGSAGRTPTLTRIDLSGRLEYQVSPPYTVRLLVDVINAWNSEPATSLSQAWTYDSVQPIVNGQCYGRNAVGGANPITRALADCPALGYLRTLDGLPVTINQNFGRPLAYLLPREVRLGLELAF